MSNTTAPLKISFNIDMRRFSRQIAIAAWSLDRFSSAIFRRASAISAGRQLLAIDRKHQKQAGLDIQIVTGTDGVTRLVTRPLGKWHTTLPTGVSR